jgi:hypothetical protein
MKWFAEMTTEWWRWDVGVGFGYYGRRGGFEMRLFLGPWSFYAGREPPTPPFNPAEWSTVTIPVEKLSA